MPSSSFKPLFISFLAFISHIENLVFLYRHCMHFAYLGSYQVLMEHMEHTWILAHEVKMCSQALWTRVKIAEKTDGSLDLPTQPGT